MTIEFPLAWEAGAGPSIVAYLLLGAFSELLKISSTESGRILPASDCWKSAISF